MKIQLKKLNARGFSHDVLIVLFVVVIAIGGTAFYVKSHAQGKDKQPSKGFFQPISDDDEGSDAGHGNNDKDNKDKPKNKKFREDIVKIAKGERGSNDAGKYNGPKGLWCASYASWVWKKAAKDNKVNLPEFGSTSDFTTWGKKKGFYHKADGKYQPQEGDVAVYGSSHVGIVVHADGNKVKMLDGNWGGKVAYHLSGKDNNGGRSGNYMDFYTSGKQVSGFVSPKLKESKH